MAAEEILPASGDRAVRLVEGTVGIVLVRTAAFRRDRRVIMRAGSKSGQRDEEQRGDYRCYPHESKAQCV